MTNRHVLMLALSLTLAFVTACAPSGGDADGAPVAPLPSEPESAPSGPASGTVPATPVSATVAEDIPGLSPRTTRGHVWAEPTLDGDEVRLSREVAALGDHVHLEVPAATGALGFIGYFADETFHLRATVCPNCGAERVEWGVSLVVCRECQTTFDLVTGEPGGDSRGFPAGTVPYEMTADSIVLSLSDLVEAHARTAAGEETLFPLLEVVEDEDRGDRSWPRCCGVS